MRSPCKWQEPPGLGHRNPDGLEGGRGPPCRLHPAVSQPVVVLVVVVIVVVVVVVVVIVVVRMGQDKVLLHRNFLRGISLS